MILIADSGSTKTDWVLLNGKKTVLETHSPGLNPALHSEEQLQKHILETSSLLAYADRINQVKMFAAGCGTIPACERLYKVLKNVFNRANIEVKEDMLGAALAASQGEESIVCILGTGSNSAYFDGKTTYPHTVSLGYTVMDEASGNYFGKILLRDYFYRRMPEHLRRGFEQHFNTDPAYVKQQLYQSPAPNAYLASFAPFLSLHRSEAYIEQILEEGMDLFFKFRITPYKKYRQIPVHFTGSIAFHLADVIGKTAERYQIIKGRIIRKPIDGLVDYFQSKSKRE